MRLVLDMNMSPRWIARLGAAGLDAVHWSSIATGGEEDTEILAWTRANGRVVLTHDLDFSRLVALSRERTPCVISLRVKRLTPEQHEPWLLGVIGAAAREAGHGVLVTATPSGLRARRLWRDPT